MAERVEGGLKSRIFLAADFPGRAVFARGRR